jgi:hypothetical protein
MLKVVHYYGTRPAKEPDAPQRCANAGFHIIDDQGPFDANCDALTIDEKLPTIKQPRRLPKQDAPEILEVCWRAPRLGCHDARALSRIA